MANLRKQFEEFHENIRLRRMSENKSLREKRDAVLKKLKSGIEKLRSDGTDIPAYREFDQGSYAMGTGVRPVDGEYDLDEGIEFELASSDFDTVKVKKWVRDALEGHTDRVKIRRNCVTVFYHLDGEPVYHIDLAIYSAASMNPDGHMHLAKGKANSGDAHCIWEPAAPEGLLDYVRDKFAGDDAAQFRRITRYLKRFKDVRFPSAGEGAPRGIGLTIIALDEFSPRTSIVDPVANKTAPDDLAALKQVVDRFLSRFAPEYDTERQVSYRRVRVRMPVVPHSDPFERMSPLQMERLEERLKELRDALAEAAADPDPHTASKTLAKQFGDDFPIPEKKDTAEVKPRAIVGSGNSAFWKRRCRR